MPLSATSTPVPLPLTPLIGRRREIELLCDLLAQPECRLITLTGTGGVGKTRIAVHVAQDTRAVEGFEVVAFVPLAALRDPAQTLPTIAQTLGLQDAGDLPLEEHLARVLATRRVLLILDNLEHLLACAPQLTQLLSACPLLTMLVTSREVLRVRGEREVPIPPLPLPANSDPAALADIRKSAAVKLLVQRAQAVLPDFALTSDNVPAVVQICYRLDGLPLAIELAAARVKLLPPQGLLSRLDHRLTLLTGGARDLPERHQTLRAALDWSYELLSESEQRLFRGLSVFPAGWTLEAAEAVLGTHSDIDVLDGLASLLDKSLVVRADRADGSPRYQMLETVREFADERLAISGEADRLHHRLVDWGLTLFGPAYTTFFSTRDHAVLARVIPELENLRAAVSWGMGHSAPARQLAVHLGWHYTIRSLLREAVTLAERVHAAAVDDLPRLRADILALLGFIAFAQLKLELGLQYAARGEALMAESKLPDNGEFLLLRWMLSFINGTFAAEAASLARAIELAGPSERAVVTMHAHGFLADVHYRYGDVERAEPLAAETLALARARNDDWCVSLAQFTLARIAGDRGDATGAWAGFVESARLGWSVRDLRQTAWCIWSMGILLVRQQLPLPAVTLLAVATTLHELRGGLVFNDGPASAGRTLAELQAALPAAEFDAAFKSGRTMSTEQAIEFAATLTLPDASSAAATAVSAPYGLTARELDVLRLLVDDRSTQEIADQLFISQRTVTTHITHIFNKLGVNSRAAAVALALRQGLV